MSGNITTGRIRFNLADRGFKAHGSPRKFNIPMLVASINSEATQERVKSRAMLGYFGHWPRVKFGHLTSVEGGLSSGKPTVVEPAVVTTFLRADPDGTVEHEVEFLTEFEGGRAAARMHKSRVGGLSSVIDGINFKYVASDYVGEPNFKHNRGYSLDSAGLILDDAYGLDIEEIETRIRDEQLHAMNMVLDAAAASTENFESMLAHANELLRVKDGEIEHLMDMLTRKGQNGALMLDSAGSQESAFAILDTAGAAGMRDLGQRFMQADLDGTHKPVVKAARMPDPRLARATAVLLG